MGRGRELPVPPPVWERPWRGWNRDVPRAAHREVWRDCPPPLGLYDVEPFFVTAPDNDPGPMMWDDDRDDPGRYIGEAVAEGFMGY